MRLPIFHSFSWLITEWIPILSNALLKSREINVTCFLRERDLVAMWSNKSRLSITDLPLLNPI